MDATPIPKSRRDAYAVAASILSNEIVQRRLRYAQNPEQKEVTEEVSRIVTSLRENAVTLERQITVEAEGHRSKTPRRPRRGRRKKASAKGG